MCHSFARISGGGGKATHAELAHCPKRANCAPVPSFNKLEAGALRSELLRFLFVSSVPRIGLCVCVCVSCVFCHWIHSLVGLLGAWSRALQAFDLFNTTRTLAPLLAY